MSNEQIKSEINKALDHLSDKTLQDVLSFLKKIQDKASLSITDQSILNKILAEDQDLLEKLAK